MENKKKIDSIIRIALKEDVSYGDITTNTLIPKKAVSEAYIVTREKAILCGLDIAKEVFRKMDRSVVFRAPYKNGDLASKNAKIIFIKGKTRALLTAERVALNFIGRLSAIATKTQGFTKKIRPYKAKIFDTRKMTPGLRILEKKAVRCGGGTNHRLHLCKMVLIKDNHKAKCFPKVSLQDMVKRVKKVTRKPIEIEVDNLREFKDALESSPNIIMLDNMTLGQIKKAVFLRKQSGKKESIQLEVSGNVNMKNVRSIAKTGVERISIGALTHTVKTIDLSLELES